MTLSVSSLRLGPALIYATCATGLKAVGSFYRMRDAQGAPQDVYRNTKRREITLLGTVFLSALLFQAVYGPLRKNIFGGIKNLFKLGNNFFEGNNKKNADTIVRSLLLLPPYILAEGLSRIVGKAPDWEKITAPASATQPSKSVRGYDDDKVAALLDELGLESDSYLANILRNGVPLKSRKEQPVGMVHYAGTSVPFAGKFLSNEVLSSHNTPSNPFNTFA